VAQLEAAVTDRRLRKFGEEPLDTNQLKQLTSVVRDARAVGLEAHPATISAIANKVSALAQADRPPPPEVLAALAEIGGYRSDLNYSGWPVFEKHYVPNFDYQLSANRRARGRIIAWGHAPIHDAARFEPIGFSKNEGRPDGPAFLEVTMDPDDKHPGDLSISGMFIKNVLIRNANIFYGGDQTILEKVYFKNCSFFVKQSPEGERFLTAVATSAWPITFVGGAKPVAE
jgi:hypothetical protein